MMIFELLYNFLIGQQFFVFKYTQNKESRTMYKGKSKTSTDFNIRQSANNIQNRSLTYLYYLSYK